MDELIEQQRTVDQLKRLLKCKSTTPVTASQCRDVIERLEYQMNGETQSNLG